MFNGMLKTLIEWIRIFDSVHIFLNALMNFLTGSTSSPDLKRFGLNNLSIYISLLPAEWSRALNRLRRINQVSQHA